MMIDPEVVQALQKALDDIRRARNEYLRGMTDPRVQKAMDDYKRLMTDPAMDDYKRLMTDATKAMDAYLTLLEQTTGYYQRKDNG